MTCVVGTAAACRRTEGHGHDAGEGVETDQDDDSDHDDGTDLTTTDGTETDDADVDPDADTDSDDEPSGDLPSDPVVGALRVMTWNIEALGGAGTEQFTAVAATLGRLRPDVACIQELEDHERDELVALAAFLGWPATFAADNSPSHGGPLLNACLAQNAFDAAHSWTASDLSPDPDAADLARDIVRVRVEVFGLRTSAYVGLLTVHLKAGQTSVDRFRRQVEITRLLNGVDRHRAEYPSDPIVVLGDFNHLVGDPANGAESFIGPPSQLPPDYSLGADIRFPLIIDPFVALEAAGFELLRPRHEDSAYDATHRPTARRIDFVAIAAASDRSRALIVEEGEIYDACKDDGIDELPEGGRVEKFGRPLECAVSSAAADHWALVIDLFVVEPD